MIRRSAIAGLIALIASGALWVVATAPAQAEGNATRCSGWSKSIPGLRYRDCLVPQPFPEGYGVRTGLQVINATRTDRWVQFYQSTIIDGKVQGTAFCKIKVRPGNNAVANCWEPFGTGYRLVPSGSRARGLGTAIDLSSGRAGWADSPEFPDQSS